MRKKNEKLTGKPYEELIYSIYKKLEPQADTRINDKILGVESGIAREIDISMRYQVAGHDLLIIVQAKDHKKPADIKILGEFDSVIRDVRASKGILICSSGFTKTAKEYARNRAIELYSAHDASRVDWKTKVEIPAIKRKIIITGHNEFSIPSEKNNPLYDGSVPGNRITYKITDFKGGLVDIGGIFFKDLIKNFATNWNNNKLNKRNGKYVISSEYKIDLTMFLYDTIPIKPENVGIVFRYNVEYRYYYKYFELESYKGIKNYVTGEFFIADVSLNKNIGWFLDDSWKYVKNIDDLPFNSSSLFADYCILKGDDWNLDYTHESIKLYWIKNGRELRNFKEKISGYSE